MKSVLYRVVLLATSMLLLVSASLAQWSPPNRPSNFKIKAGRDGLIDLTWNLTLGGAFYNVLTSYDGGTTWGYLAFGYGSSTNHVVLQPAPGQPLYAVEVLMFSPPDHISTPVSWLASPPYYPPASDASPKLGSEGGAEGKYADPLNLATGTQSYSPRADLDVYNPNGPSVSFKRTYDSGLAGFGYNSPGLSQGWVHNYDVVVTNDGNTSTWSDLELVFANGAKIAATPQLSGGGTPTGAFTVPSGSNFKITGVPSGTTGLWTSITVTWADESKWVFDTLIDRYYVLTQIVNKVGRGVTLNWDGTRRLTDISDTTTSSTLLTVNYNGSGDLISVDDCYGRSIYYTYGSVGGFPSPALTNASQTVTTGTPSPASRAAYGYTVISGRLYLSQVTVPSPTGAGTTVNTINYNPTTYKVSSLVDGNGNKTVLTYNANATLIEIKTPSNVVERSWTANFDSLNRDTGTTDALNNSTVLQYNDSSNPRQVTDSYDGNGNHTSATYDSFGNLLTTTNRQGVTQTFTYDYTGFSLGRISQYQEGTRAATSYSYYSNGLLQTVTSPQPNFGGTQTTTYSYDSLGNVTQIVSPGNNAAATLTTSLNYTTDGVYSQAACMGQPIAISDNLGNVTHLRYDSQGRLTSVRDAVGNQTDYTYNIVGQTLQRILPATGQTGVGQAEIDTTYVFPGGPVYQQKVYNESGVLSRTTTYGFGAEGELLNVSGATQTVSYTYDSAYRRKTVSDGNSGVTTYAYDAQGCLASITSPAGNPIQFTSYDAAGNLLTRIDNNGVTTNYLYNGPGGTLSDIQYPATPSLDQSFGYDSLVRLNSITDGTGQVTVSYDDLNNVVSQSTTYTSVPTQTVSYTYYPSGSRETMTSSAGTWTYYYDGADRYSSMTSPVGTSTADYFANGWQQKRELPNGVETEYTYNALGQMTGLRNGPNPSYLSLYNGFTYDSGFNLTGITITDSLTPSLSGTTSYAFDTKDRLTSSASTRGAGFSLGLGYDSAFNFTGITGGTALTFNSNNQLTNTGFTYDDNGNPTTYKSTALGFDPQNRLTTYGAVFSADYRADGLRAWTQNSSGKTYYIYDGVAPLYEIDGTGAITAINVYAPDGLVARKKGSTWSQYLFDQQGSVCQTLDNSGTLVFNSVYNDYGSGAVQDVFGFNARSGYYFDQDTGLYHCRNRYYDPSLARWLTRDPAGFLGGANLYAYNNSNPIGSIDPSGLDSEGAKDLYYYTDAGQADGLRRGGLGGFFEYYGSGAVSLAADLLGGRQVKGYASKTGTAVANGDWPESIAYTTGIVAIGASDLMGIGGSPAVAAESEVAHIAAAEGRTYSVYMKTTEEYVGITNDIARRSGEWGEHLEPLARNLSYEDARAIEQVIIEHHGMIKNGGALTNRINSIAASNPKYSPYIQRGWNLIRALGIPLK